MDFLGSLIGLILGLNQTGNEKEEWEERTPEVRDSDEEVVSSSDRVRRRKRTGSDITGGLMGNPTLGRNALMGL